MSKFLGHLVQRRGYKGAFVPAGEPIPLMKGRGTVTPIYDDPQNVAEAGETDTFSEDLGFDPYGEREQLAMGWILQLVGKMLGAEGWVQGDGSETVEGDCAREFQNIMTAAGLVTADGDMLTADRFREWRNELVERCAIAAEMQDRVGYEWVRDSIWDNFMKRGGAAVRLLKVGGEA